MQECIKSQCKVNAPRTTLVQQMLLNNLFDKLLNKPLNKLLNKPLNKLSNNKIVNAADGVIQRACG